MVEKYCIKTIKDPVHGTIELFPLEQIIIDHPIFQRLRQVSQQGLTCYTFPSDQHSRAPHSFGTMHFAGEMFQSAIENSHLDALVAFIEDGLHLIEIVAKNLKFTLTDLKNEVDSLIGSSVGFNHKPHFFKKHLGHEWVGTNSDGEQLTYNDAIFVYRVLWQSVRIASLVHDLGHLPYSHTFEEAIKLVMAHNGNSSQAKAGTKSNFLKSCQLMDDEWKDVCKELFCSIGIGTKTQNNTELTDKRDAKIFAGQKERLAIHEQIGILLCERFEWDRDKKSEPLWVVATTIGRLIFACKPIEYSSLRDKKSDLCKPQYKILQAMHTIVSGELDADRLDYCIRDPASAAVHQDSVDSQEIVRNMQLVLIKPNHCDHHAYAIVVRAKALPYIETYFLQRYMGYRTIINHHNVMRYDCLLKIALSSLIRLADRIGEEDKQLIDVFRQMGYYSQDPSSNKGEKSFEMVELFRLIVERGEDGFEKYDDAWVRTLMRLIFEKLSEVNEPKRDEIELKLMLEACLYRHSDMLLSVAKNDGTFLSWRSRIAKAAKKQIEVYRDGSEKYPPVKMLDLKTIDVSKISLDKIDIESHLTDLLCTKWSKNTLVREASLRFEKTLQESAERIISKKIPDGESQNTLVVPLISFAPLKLLDSRGGEGLESESPKEDWGSLDESKERLPIAGRVTIDCSSELDGTDLCDLTQASTMLQSMNKYALPKTRVLHLAFLGKSVCLSDVPDELDELSVQLLGKLCAENAILDAWEPLSFQENLEIN